MRFLLRRSGGCATYSPAVEPLDETEAFIELSFCPNILDVLGELSGYVENIVGISPLYGIARCKLVARIISGILPEARTKRFQRLTEHMVSCEGRNMVHDYRQGKGIFRAFACKSAVAFG